MGRGGGTEAHVLRTQAHLHVFTPGPDTWIRPYCKRLQNFMFCFAA